MKYYPVHLDVRNRNCLVVGGGDVGARKVVTLLDCGAIVTVVSPSATEPLRELATNRSIIWEIRPYRTSDLEGMFIVIGATDDDVLNLKIYKDAGRRNILCNIADRPEACNFILPSIVNRGDLVITISTSGKSPAFAKHLRTELENRFGEEHAEFLRLMGALRKKLLKTNPGAHKHRFEELISRGLVELIRNQDKDGIDAMLREIFGDGYDFDTLMRNP